MTTALQRSLRNTQTVAGGEAADPLCSGEERSSERYSWRPSLALVADSPVVAPAADNEAVAQRKERIAPLRRPAGAKLEIASLTTPAARSWSGCLEWSLAWSGFGVDTSASTPVTKDLTANLTMETWVGSRVGAGGLENRRPTCRAVRSLTCPSALFSFPSCSSAVWSTGRKHKPAGQRHFPVPPRTGS